jgi:hypothetical protein
MAVLKVQNVFFPPMPRVVEKIPSGIEIGNPEGSTVN